MVQAVREAVRQEIRMAHQDQVQLIHVRHINHYRNVVRMKHFSVQRVLDR